MFLTVLRRVFRHTRYRVIVVGVALAVISAALLLPNRTVVEQVVFSEAIDSGDKFAFVTSIFASLGTNFTILSSSYLILVAILFGVNIALLTFYIRRRQEVSRNTKVHFASIGGMASAILGIGCAACGSVVLTALLGLFGASGLILFLPLHGIEFGIIGILLLLLSIRFLAKKIDDPLVCPVKL